MSKPVAAYRRGESIALIFEDGVGNEFDASMRDDAEMSIVCFDGRQQGWTEIPVDEGISEAVACGFEMED